MGGWFSFVVCLAPALLMFRSGHTALGIIAIANAATNLWSFGVMHNYAVERSARRIKRLRDNLQTEGCPDHGAQRRIESVRPTKDLKAVPPWLTSINMLTALAGVALLVWALVV